MQTGTHLLQEGLGNLGSPNGQGLVARGQNTNRGILIDEIAVGVMFNHVACWIPPIVENLGSQNMSAHAPDGLIALPGQPLMSQVLGVIVMDLKGAMVHMRVTWADAEKERVVVRVLLAQVQVHKCSHIRSVTVMFHVKQISGNDIEIRGVE